MICGLFSLNNHVLVWGNANFEQKQILMKTTSTLTFLSIFFLGFILEPIQLNGQETMSTHRFLTSGNCGICLNTIQTAGNNVEGVSVTNWNVTQDETTVTYDNTVTDLFQIMTAIASSGYDTEWYPADSAAYQGLVGSCCEYTRVIDYSSVQLGYLSLMDIWVTPLDITEQDVSDITLFYPNPSTGIISLDQKLLENNASIEMYNLIGSKVFELETVLNKKLDLSFLPKGQYIFVMKNDNVIVAHHKLIKL